MTSPFRTPEDIRKDKTRFIDLQENFLKLQENLAKLEKLDNKNRSHTLLRKISEKRQKRISTTPQSRYCLKNKI